jgi:hypothetical protein
MTEARARMVANMVIVSAGAAAAYVVLTTPPLRRLAWLGVRWWLGASLPLYVATQVSQAWVESGREGRKRSVS